MFNSFHPVIQNWFKQRYGEPTDIQKKAWPLIARGEHVLVSAPTGSGKTLCAFLWAIDSFLTGRWESGRVRVVYLSPLKALNNDIQKNLLEPLTEIQAAFSREGISFPDIRVQTRSGDTPSNERQKMNRRPPEIFITTPESLHIMLTGKQGSTFFAGIQTVILDEIHALANSKRGALFISSIERLTLCNESFQRIALSATINPIEKIRRFVGGYELRHGGEPQYKPRHVEVVQSRLDKSYDVSVVFPENALEHREDDSHWPPLIDMFQTIIEKNQSTLFFVNSRTKSEKVTRLLNEGQPTDVAYSHHGSLSREIRFAVEQKLKAGKLKAIIATSSLELGIDVGDLDEVVMLQVPNALSSAIQRTGRAGHQVGQVSRARLVPLHGREFLDAAVTARSIHQKEIEPLATVDAPLDVLAQLVLSMVCHEAWHIDDLYQTVRCSAAFHSLERKSFDLVIEMLAGRYANTKVRELSPKINLDKLEGTLKARDHVPFLIYSSGGTIPDRGYFNLRRQDTKVKIGELDEEFVWERSLGDTFVLGSQIWQIQKITDADVEVVPCQRPIQIIPFWKAETQDRDFFFSSKVGELLETLEELGDKDVIRQFLSSNHSMDQASISYLLKFLDAQRSSTHGKLPHRHHLVIEHYDDPHNRSDRKQVILHTHWGGRVNRPFALAFSAAWEETYGAPLQLAVSNEAILFMFPHEFTTEQVLELIEVADWHGFLRKKLESTGFFGTRFRENAGRALLLPSGGFRKRMPLWLNRLRSKKLLETIKSFENFPILLETWRTCLKDEFDMESLNLVIDELKSGQIRVTECITKRPSPFCGDIVYRQVDQYMYEDDSPLGAAKSNLSDHLIRELMSSDVKPKFQSELIDLLDAKLKQIHPGYAPETAEDVRSLVIDRLLMPKAEWKDLLSAIDRDYQIDLAELEIELTSKLAWMVVNNEHFMFALENLVLIENLFKKEGLSWDVEALGDAKTFAKALDRARNLDTNELELEAFLIQWLGYYAVCPLQACFSNLPFNDSNLLTALENSADQGLVVLDRLTEDSEEVGVAEWRNFEILLRMKRKRSRVAFTTLTLKKLPLFLAQKQGLTIKGRSPDDLQTCLDSLFGYPLPAGAWEASILPSRLTPYFPHWLDALMATSPLVWMGFEKQHIAFCFEDEVELLRDGCPEGTEAPEWFPNEPGRFTLLDLVARTGKTSASVSKKLWDEAFKGRLTNDNMETLRKACLHKFKVVETAQQSRSRRYASNRWNAQRPMQGHWFRLNFDFDNDPISSLERNKDRVRLLLERYGLLFKQLLDREIPQLRWGHLFRTMKLMELSGELIMGTFFEEIPGLQFTNHENLRALSQPLNDTPIFWCAAKDPASLCGMDLESVKRELPARQSNTYLVYHGTKVVVIAWKTGRELELDFHPDSKEASNYFEFFKTLLTREFNPIPKILVEHINGKPAIKSVYAKCLKEFGFIEQPKGLELWRQF